MQRTIAAFDFDGTLTYRDTLLSFLQCLNGKTKLAGNLLLTIPEFLNFSLSRLNPDGQKSENARQKAKEALLKKSFSDCSYSYACDAGHIFSHKDLKTHIRPEAFKRLLWHKSQNHECVLVSANLDLYLKPWGAQNELDAVISSVVNPDMSGNLIGKNCWGKEKVTRLLEWAGPKKDFILYAYGDSQGDKELLAIADYPFYQKFS